MGTKKGQKRKTARRAYTKTSRIKWGSIDSSKGVLYDFIKMQR